MNKLLFLCTGNYYRSRFAELYFRHLAAWHGMNWDVDSRGLQLEPRNQGPLSRYTLLECQRLGISPGPLRPPLALEEADLAAAGLAVAVKESEHRPLMRWLFPQWEDRIEYWEVHDLDCGPASEALPQLRQLVDALAERLRTGTADANGASRR